MADIFRIPLSPAERWGLLSLFAHPKLEVRGELHGKLKRARRALGIDNITTAIEANQEAGRGLVNMRQARSRVPALHTLTKETAEAALKLADDLGVDPRTSDEIAEALERLADGKAGRLPLPEGIPEYDQAADAPLWLVQETAGQAPKG